MNCDCLLGSPVDTVIMAASITQFLFGNFPVKLNPAASVMYLLALVYFPHLIKRSTVVKKLKGSGKQYSIATSRSSSAAAVDNTPEGQFVANCINCHQNTWEAFSYYTATLILSILCQVPNDVVRGFAGFFLTNRILYMLVYLSSLNGPLRSVVFFAGLFAVLFMLGFAAESSGGLFA